MVVGNQMELILFLFKAFQRFPSSEADYPPLHVCHCYVGEISEMRHGYFTTQEKKATSTTGHCLQTNVATSLLTIMF